MVREIQESEAESSEDERRYVKKENDSSSEEEDTREHYREKVVSCDDSSSVEESKSPTVKLTVQSKRNYSDNDSSDDENTTLPIEAIVKEEETSSKDDDEQIIQKLKRYHRNDSFESSSDSEENQGKLLKRRNNKNDSSDGDEECNMDARHSPKLPTRSKSFREDDSSSDGEEQRGKSPLKITKTEIVNTKYTIIQEQHSGASRSDSEDSEKLKPGKRSNPSSMKEPLKKLDSQSKSEPDSDANSSSSEQERPVKKDEIPKKQIVSRKLEENSKDSSSEKSDQPVEKSTEKYSSPVQKEIKTENKESSDDSTINEKQPSVEYRVIKHSKRAGEDSSSDDEEYVEKYIIPSPKSSSQYSNKDNGDHQRKPKQLKKSKKSRKIHEKQNSEESSSEEEIASTAEKLKRKSSKANSSEKNAVKVTALSKKKSSHDVSDSDEDDSLTRLNTALNKSMALMENKADKSQTATLNKSVKIKINTNVQPPTSTAASEVRPRKSILKRPEPARPNEANDSDVPGNENGEQNQQGDIEDKSTSIRPKIIPRPLNLQDFVCQDALIVDPTDTTFRLGDISDSDEMWILDVPSTINPRDLNSQTITLGGRSKFRIGDDRYEALSKGIPSRLSCVFNTGRERKPYKIVNVQPTGSITVRKRLSNALKIELESSEKTTVPFPKNLKLRHPLFGAAYKDKVVLTAEDTIGTLDTLQMNQKKSRMKTNNSRSQIFAETVKNRSMEVDKFQSPKVKKSKKHKEGENNLNPSDTLQIPQELSSNNSRDNRLKDTRGNASHSSKVGSVEESRQVHMKRRSVEKDSKSERAEYLNSPVSNDSSGTRTPPMRSMKRKHSIDSIPESVTIRKKKKSHSAEFQMKYEDSAGELEHVKKSKNRNLNEK